jgi:hypothetical protein
VLGKTYILHDCPQCKGPARLLLKLEDTPLGSIVRILHLHDIAERFLLPRTLRFQINGTPVDFTVYRLKLFLAKAGVPPDEEL